MIRRGLVAALAVAAALATGCPGSGKGGGSAEPAEVEIDWPDAAVPPVTPGQGSEVE